MNFINQSNSNQVYNSNMTWNPFRAPTFWSPLNSISDIDSDQSSNYSLFSTPTASPYGSPPQTLTQYAPMSLPKLPKPIAKPSTKSLKYHISKLPKRSEHIDMSEFIRKSRSTRTTHHRTMMCTFCKTNGESEEIYSSHSLKNSVNKITCPILMRYTCVECGASGENTHTIRYCPVMQKKLRKQTLSKLVSNNC